MKIATERAVIQMETVEHAYSENVFISDSRASSSSPTAAI